MNIFGSLASNLPKHSNDYIHDSTTLLEKNISFYVQSNQKMHDLYATKHISEMVLPVAFWSVFSQIFS